MPNTFFFFMNRYRFNFALLSLFVFLFLFSFFLWFLFLVIIEHQIIPTFTRLRKCNTKYYLTKIIVITYYRIAFRACVKLNLKIPMYPACVKLNLKNKSCTLHVNLPQFFLINPLIFPLRYCFIKFSFISYN